MSATETGTLQELLREWDDELGRPAAEDYAWAEEQLNRITGDDSRAVHPSHGLAR